MQLFWAKVYRNSKGLFFIFSLYVLGQLFFSIKMVQTFPFFNYGMYSAPQPRYNTYTALVVDVNGKHFDPYEYGRFAIDFMYSNLWEYDKLREHNWKDPVEKTVRSRFEGKVEVETLAMLLQQLTIQQEDIDRFMPWLHRHIQQIYSEPIETLTVKKLIFGYTAEKEYQQWGEQTIATYQKTPR